MDWRKVASALAVVALVLWGLRIVRNKNADTDRRVAEAGGRAEPAGGLSAAAQAMSRHLAFARDAIKAGDYYAAGLDLYNAYPSFESLLMEQGYKEVQPGLTLQAWFDREKDAVVGALRDEYPMMLARLRSGDLASRSFKGFLLILPQVFSGELRQQFERGGDEREVQQERTVNAKHWIMVSVISQSGSSEAYERAIRDVLKTKAGGLQGYKLVLDTPMTQGEGEAAARLLHATITEHYAEYEFGRGDEGRGGGQVPESVTLELQADSSGVQGPATSWDALPAIAVTSPAPEKVSFQFDNERQTASFRALEDGQRQALIAELSAAAAQSIPALTLR